MRYKLWVNGDWEETGDTKVISCPYNGNTVAICEQATSKLIERAIQSASDTFPFFKKSSRYARSLLLQKISEGIEKRKTDFIESIVNEAGKPIQLAEIEVNRGITTFQIASEEAKRYNGQLISLDGDKSGVGFDSAQTFFVPKGVVLAITPFNFPLNLVAHKVAPALAIGACVILKPSPEAPGASNLLTEVFIESAKFVSETFEKIPNTILQLVHCSNELASEMVKDSRITIISFTGSDRVGWSLQELATKKKICLELGGNAAVIVHKDADIDLAARRCAIGAFSYAGQICISVQRIFIHHEIYYDFKKKFIKESGNMIAGDPHQKETWIGPLINKRARDRIFSWVQEAKEEGAVFLSSVSAVDNIIYPIILESVPTHLDIYKSEVFGPVAILDNYFEFSNAVEKVNESRFGLQVGVFTDSDKIMRQAIDDIDSGAILFNEIPTFRADHMPYGGVKESGLGREGIIYAMEEFSERKTIIKRRVI